MNSADILELDTVCEPIETVDNQFAVTGWNADISIKPFGVGLSFGLSGIF